MESVPSTSNLGGQEHHIEAEGTPFNPTTIHSQIENLECAIRKGDLPTVKKIIDFLLDDPNKIQLAYPSEKSQQCITHKLIISACEHNQADILFYLFHETDILEYLTNKTLGETQQDELRKRAFIFAIRSGDVSIVETLYNHWRGDMHWSANNIDGDINLISRLAKILNEAKDACNEYLTENLNIQSDVNSFIKFNEFQLTVHINLRQVLPQITEDDTVMKARSIITEVLCAYEHSDVIKYSNTTLYQDWWIYLLHEKYIIKLDFYVSLFILDNLNILIENNNGIAAEIYDEIYHYIYRVFDDWRLYYPKNRTITKERVSITHNGKPFVYIDGDKIAAMPVLFLERRKFKTCLRHLNIALRRQNKKDLNYLINLPHMRDYYSLKKMVYYLEVVENDLNNNSINVLTIERALQVFGEMSKSNEESHHLEKTTEALLQTEISVDTIKSIRSIRLFISHVKNGELSSRIEIAENNNHIFLTIQKDIKIILEAVKSVLEIIEPILDKTVLQNGLELISERINEWPCEARLDDIDLCINDDERLKKYQEEIWAKTGLEEDLFKEITATLKFRNALDSKIHIIKNNIIERSKSKLKKYMANIKYTHELIKQSNQKWESVKVWWQKCYKNKRIDDNYPTQNDIQKLSQVKNKRLSDEIKQLKVLSEHWESLKNVLTFFFREIWNEDSDLQKLSISSKSIDDINDKITLIETRLVLPQNNLVHSAPQHTFDGIEELSKIIKKYELENKFKGKDKNFRENEFKVELQSNFKNRVGMLSIILGYPNMPLLSQHRRRYIWDPKFRSEVEMLLLDIYNIYSLTRKQNLMIKSNKLLAGIKPRNVLGHGNPILEVTGDVLDRYDFCSELLSRAREIAQDPNSIETDLFKGT